MSTAPPSRTASVAEPRRTSASLRQKSRPASAAIDQENRPDSKASTTRKSSTTTTETRTERRTIDERLIRRTRSPLKPTESNASGGRKSKDGGERGQRAEKARKEEMRASIQPTTWSPQATLLPPSSGAPLAGRVSIPPQSQHAPASVHPPPFNGLGLEQQESALVEDLLYVLMGFEGQYVRYVESYNPLDEQSRLIGPNYRIANGLDPSLRDLAGGMLKTATHFAALELFVETMGREECGSVSHALCASIRKLLKEYLILIAQLEHQALTNEGFTLHQMNLHLKPTGHMLTQLYSLAQEVLKENSMLGDLLEDDTEQADDFENILESLREGRDTSIPGKRTCKGGSVLRLITKRLQSSSGDPAAYQLLQTLLRDSGKPYMRMLNEWLHHGNVRDPHNEFLIKEQKSIRREGLQQDYTDEYWEKRYTIRLELIPPQLEAVKDRVLLAGKYLNVVRECGGITDINRDLSNSEQVPHTFSDPRFLENVSNAYAFANRSLMTLLLTTHGLPARLKSLKHYFFLDRSDFFSYFLELSASELKKTAKNVNAGKLQSLLDIVLRQPGSVAAEDPFKEDVRVTMSDTGLTGWLMRVVNVQGMDADASSLSLANTYTGSVTGKDEKEISGYEALTLDYAVPFPLSLIVSRNTLTRYQLLFRYLLSLRHLEVLLTQSWTEHTKSPAWIRKGPRRKGASADSAGTEVERKIENWKRRAWCLRARMLCFVQQLLYFCTSEVIEPNWRSFMARVEEARDGDEELQGLVQDDTAAGATQGGSAGPSATTATSRPATAKSGSATLPKVKRTVDELMQDHVDFLATCLKECQLTNSKLLRINSKVTSTCILFANYTSSLSRYLASLSPDENGNTAATAPDPAKLDKLFSILHQYEDHFSRHLKILLDALNYLAATETVVFLGLCARLSMAGEGGRGGGAGPSAYG
ncbi:gamma tubulin complex Spc97/GCP2 subunit Alp4 [Recurvomyces mirabilis]|nr:gamma tubulin complex Spc97/GCP2 subunit Alp4 [Recurvomyces mirabilis]